MAEDNFNLPKDTLDVWLLNLDRHKYDEALFWQLLDQREQTQAVKFRKADLRQRYIHTHGLLRQILAEYVSESNAKALQILPATFGKPYLPDFPKLSFNLSHSGAWVLIAVAYDLAIGVDIEVVRPRVGMQGLVDKCLAASEREYWQQIPAEHQVPVFFDFWTRKEALVKAVGRGIALGLEQCVVDTRTFSNFVSLPADCWPSEQWRIFSFDLDEPCRGAVVAAGDNLVLRMRNGIAETSRQ